MIDSDIDITATFSPSGSPKKLGTLNVMGFSQTEIARRTLASVSMETMQKLLKLFLRQGVLIKLMPKLNEVFCV